MAGCTIECALFENSQVWHERLFERPFTALSGQTCSGSSTLLDALWWTLGVAKVKLMPAAAACSRIGFIARVGGVRWQITRSTGGQAREVCFTDLTHGGEDIHPVTRTGTRRSAADVFQDLLQIPRLGTGNTRITMDLLLPWLYARQADLPVRYLAGQSTEQRTAVGRVLLGADDEALDALRQQQRAAAKAWGQANGKVKRILRGREERELPTVEDLQRRTTRWTAEHQAACRTVREAGAALRRGNEDLATLQRQAAQAEEDRRAARAGADERERTARTFTAVAAQARGRPAGLREAAAAAAADPTMCAMCVRPLDLAGLSQDDCPACRRFDPERRYRADRFQRRIGEAQLAADRAAQSARGAEEAADQARVRAGDADRAGLEAAAAVRAFEQDTIAPLQRRVTDAEAQARELAARLEQNTEHLRELAELTDLQAQLPQMKHDKEAAEAAYATARHDSDLIVKQATDRWSDHLLRRLQACDPQIRTASISPDDFSVTVNGAPFDTKAVAGHGLARITISVLLALRDTARDIPAMPVPNLLVVDGPFAGLGTSPEDRRTAAAILDGLAELATRAHPVTGPGQALIACTDLPHPNPAIHEIPTSLTDGAIPGLPSRQRTHN